MRKKSLLGKNRMLTNGDKQGQQEYSNHGFSLRRPNSGLKATPHSFGEDGPLKETS